MQQGWQRSWARHSWVVVWLLFGVFAASVDAAAPPRGYQARACGFDLNFNGILSEPADCNRVCSGANAPSSLDIDGNLVLDKQVFVDSAVGVDNASCGAAGSPCKTIAWAMNASNTAFPQKLTSPAPNQMQALCLAGTFTEAITMKFSGALGDYIQPPKGSATTGFIVPRYPFIVSGWDKSGNGSYPPFDTADTAVLDGSAGIDQAVLNNSGPQDHFEIAHLTFKNFGQAVNSNDQGFTTIGSPSGIKSDFYYHDLVLQDIMRGNQSNTSPKIMFSYFVGGMQPSNVFVSNINVTNAGGGYFSRGAPFAGSGARFQNISYTSYVTNTSVQAGCPMGFKIWGLIGADVLDNDFNSQAGLWSAVNGVCVFTSVVQTSQNWTFRNNIGTDYRTCFVAQPFASGSANTRDLDNIVFDRNICRQTYAGFGTQTIPVQLEQGGSECPANSGDAIVPCTEATKATACPISQQCAHPKTGNITITNNMFSTTQNMEACFWLNEEINDGPAYTGVTTIAGNTCYAGTIGGTSAWAGITLGNLQFADLSIKKQNFVIKDNVFAAIGSGKQNTWTGYIPAVLTLDGNVYDPAGTFVWNRTAATNFATWKANSGEGSASKQCAPTFMNTSTGDLHLNELTAPYCARDAGVPLTGITSTDIDGDTRPTPAGGAWDAGADEYATSTGVLGDLDGNSVVDVLDLQRMVNVLLGLETDQAVIARADLDGVGGPTILDLQRLVNLLLGV